jgi:ABC-type multidrug transport system fused ATPase/permease subunit
LEDVTFEIRPGSIVGIVGSSGSGKSTLAQLLLRLLDFDTGQLLGSGHPASTFSLREWYRAVGYVPQEPLLLSDTVRANIAFCRSIESSVIERSAQLAGIHQEILSLPLGYDTRLGHGGSGLSGGQRQRLCIARALAGEPQVLILDVPTAALDPVSACKVLETLEDLKPDRAIVLITHHSESLAVCDEIITISQGKAIKAAPVKID